VDYSLNQRIRTSTHVDDILSTSDHTEFDDNQNGVRFSPVPVDKDCAYISFDRLGSSTNTAEQVPPKLYGQHGAA
jgi:hypothetical protein